MGAPFSDITLYTPTPHPVGTPEYWEDISLKNFVSDLYVQKMYGYKPPKTSRITIQPVYHNIGIERGKMGQLLQSRLFIVITNMLHLIRKEGINIFWTLFK